MHEAGRRLAEAVVRRVLEAASPGPALRKVWREPRPGPVTVIAVGKASAGLARTGAELVGARLRRGLAITPPEDAPGLARALPGWEVLAADHPLPTDRNVSAAGRALEVARSCGREETLVVLVSGGGSSHLTLPAPGVSLGEIVRVTRDLQRSGATINELNAVRKHVEVLKGGGLAAACGAGALEAYILSDVMGDRLDVIASGPTVADSTTFADAMAVLGRRGIDVPRSVRERLERGAAGGTEETLKAGDPRLANCRATIMGNNGTAVDAACGAVRGLGVEVIAVRQGVEGEAAEIGRDLGRELAGLPGAGARAIVLGGEPTVTVGAAGGAGGPSQELALSAAKEIDGHEGSLVLAFSTDGRDGPTDAAGALVDSETWGRAGGMDAERALAEHNSRDALGRAGALLVTGPTGTNVNHVVVCVAGWDGA